MRCVEFERQLNQLLDERTEIAAGITSLPRALRTHAVTCDACQTLFSGYQTMLTGLALEVVPSHSTMLVERVISDVTPAPRRRQFSAAWAVLTTAASLALFVGLSQVSRGPETDIATSLTTPVLATQTGLAVSSKPVETPVVTPRRTFGFTAPSRLELDQRSLGVVLNLAGFGPVTFSAEVLESHLAEKPGWMVEVADGLKPVTETMTGTLNALWNVLPRSDDAKDADQGARYEPHGPHDRIA